MPRLLMVSTGRHQEAPSLPARASCARPPSSTYEEAQAAIDGQPDDKTGPLLDTVLQAAVGGLCEPGAARATEREPLELDLPERKIMLDAQGRIERVVTPARASMPTSSSKSS